MSMKAFHDQCKENFIDPSRNDAYSSRVFVEGVPAFSES